MAANPRAGQPAQPEDLIDIASVVTAYYTVSPDPDNVDQQVAFGTSGHRGSALSGSFNEAHIAATTQAAMAAAPAREQSREGMANIVRTISGDIRVGRLLFSAHLDNPVVVRKRAESGALFALLSGQHAGSALRLEQNDRLKAAGHFVVGGVAQTLSAWLAGDLAFTPAQLATQLGALIDQLADPALYRD